MKRTRNALLLVLAVLLLFPRTMTVAGTEIIGTIDTEENALISARLEAMAEEYVTKYIHTAYLYEEEDFVTGTLLEMSEETLAKTGLTTLKVNETEEKIADLLANLQQFADVAEYFKYVCSEQEGTLRNLQLAFRNINTLVKDDYAEVSLYTLVTFFTLI